MNGRAAEWIKQSDYDLDTAKYMFSGGRYTYAVFMCHLAAEKAIKDYTISVPGRYHPRPTTLYIYSPNWESSPKSIWQSPLPYSTRQI